LKKYLIALTAAGLTLSACVKPEQTTTTGPTGKTMATVKCSQSPNGCYESAATTCTGSYNVLDSYSKAGGLVADIIPGPVTWYYMTYQCGPTNGRLPSFAFRGQSYKPPVYVAPTTTTCNRYGNNVRCNTY
jgi:hypothetical protein